MKALSLIVLFLFTSACSRQQTGIINKIQRNDINCDSNKWYKTAEDRDSLLISIDSNVNTYYKKGELKKLVFLYPELVDTTRHYSPDVSYSKVLDLRVPCNPNRFDCEVCKDDFFVLYAYFLKQQNGEIKYAGLRKSLIKIYRSINYIFGQIAQGGTYFGHQDTRILAYAEYGVYLKKNDIYNDRYTRNYNISTQKSFYINSLKQRIIDDVNYNSDIDPELKENLFKTVGEIDKLITDYGKLKMAQEFQYSYY